MAKIITPGMQNNASLSWILKTDSAWLLREDEWPPLLIHYCKWFFLPGKLASEQPSLWPPSRSLQIFQADTLAPLVALGLCWCWPAGSDSFHLLSPCFISCHIRAFDLPWSQALPRDWFPHNFQGKLLQQPRQGNALDAIRRWCSHIVLS